MCPDLRLSLGIYFTLRASPRDYHRPELSLLSSPIKLDGIPQPLLACSISTVRITRPRTRSLTADGIVPRTSSGLHRRRIELTRDGLCYDIVLRTAVEQANRYTMEGPVPTNTGKAGKDLRDSSIGKSFSCPSCSTNSGGGT